MFQLSDQFSKNLLREIMSRFGTPETEVEVVAATQKIDVYCVPDPALAGQRAETGVLGELCAEPGLFETFSSTPTLAVFRRCANKQLTWHHELERRARGATGGAGEGAEPTPAPPFPVLVVISQGRPESVLQGYRFEAVGAGVYGAAPALSYRLLVLSELPRTRETLMLRLLGANRILREALADLAALPPEAWEHGVANPLLLHFRIEELRRPDEEADDMATEFRQWYEGYLRDQKHLIDVTRQEGRQEGQREGERALLKRQLRSRFGDVPAAVSARIETADDTDVDRWSVLILTAHSLDEVFEDPH